MSYCQALSDGAAWHQGSPVSQFPYFYGRSPPGSAAATGTGVTGRELTATGVQAYSCLYATGD